MMIPETIPFSTDSGKFGRLRERAAVGRAPRASSSPAPGPGASPRSAPSRHCRRRRRPRRRESRNCWCCRSAGCRGRRLRAARRGCRPDASSRATSGIARASGRRTGFTRVFWRVGRGNPSGFWLGGADERGRKLHLRQSGRRHRRRQRAGQGDRAARQGDGAARARTRRSAGSAASSTSRRRAIAIRCWSPPMTASAPSSSSPSTAAAMTASASTWSRCAPTISSSRAPSRSSSSIISPARSSTPASPSG